MNATAINQTVEIIPLLGYELKKAGGYHVGACPFCGGKDRFTVKHTRDGDRCHCRQCWDGKYHTVIDYIIRRDNADFKTALKILGGDTLVKSTNAAQPKPTPKPIQIPAQDWQREAWREIDTACDALTRHPQGRAFLTSRGLSRAMREAWHLGFMFAYDPVAKRKRPAIVIPWYDMDEAGETLTAVKYRFIDSDPNPKALRYSCKMGSTFDVPFGLRDMLSGSHSLLYIEGEFNCISVSQCRPAGVSILSFGSEGGGDPRILQSLAGRYKNVYVWADDIWDNPKQSKHAKELRALVRGRGTALRSVKHGEVKQDANQLLQAGALSEFLSRVLGVECENTRGEK